MIYCFSFLIHHKTLRINTPKDDDAVTSIQYYISSYYEHVNKNVIKFQLSRNFLPLRLLYCDML